MLRGRKRLTQQVNSRPETHIKQSMGRPQYLSFGRMAQQQHSRATQRLSCWARSRRAGNTTARPPCRHAAEVNNISSQVANSTSNCELDDANKVDDATASATKGAFAPNSETLPQRQNDRRVMVTDLTNALTIEEMNFLTKGPKFRIVSKLDGRSWLNVESALCRLSYQLRW